MTSLIQLPRVLPAAGAVLAAVVLNLDRMQAQTAPAQPLPRFEVTSVKRNVTPEKGVMSSYRNGRLTTRAMTVAALIRSAYQVQEFQIIGGPAWVNGDYFDVSATASAENAVEPNIPGEPSRESLMLRALLDDRFKLRVHKETREMPVYALVPARKDGTLGPQLTRASYDCTPGSPRPAVPAAGRGNGPTLQCGSYIGPGMLTGKARTMAQFATMLSNLTNTGSSLNRLIVDRTGLTGSYDIELRFTPENIPNVPGLPPIDPNGPSIFTAMQEQLGLRLESQRAPVDVLVIDSVQPPTED